MLEKWNGNTQKREIAQSSTDCYVTVLQGKLLLFFTGLSESIMLRRALVRYAAAAPNGGSNPHINVKPATPSATNPVQPRSEAPKVAPKASTPPPQSQVFKAAPEPIPKGDGKLSGTPKMGVNPSLYKEAPKIEKKEEVKDVSATPTSASSTSNSPASDSVTSSNPSESAATSNSASEEKINRLLTQQYESLIQMANGLSCSIFTEIKPKQNKTN